MMAFLSKLYAKAVSCLNTIYTLFLEEIDAWVLFYEYVTNEWMWFKAHEHIFFAIIKSLIVIFILFKLFSFVFNYLDYLESHISKNNDYNECYSKTIYKIKVFVQFVSNKSL